MEEGEVARVAGTLQGEQAGRPGPLHPRPPREDADRRATEATEPRTQL